MASKTIHIIITKEFILRALIGNQIKKLLENGWTVHLYFDQDNSWDSLRKWNKVHIHQIPFERDISFYKDLRVFILLLKALRNKEGVFCYSTPKASLIGSLSCFLLRKKSTIYFMRGRVYENYKGFKRTVFNLIEKWICGVSKKVVFLTLGHLEEFILMKTVKKAKATIIHNGSGNGIDLERFKFSKPEKMKIKKDLGYNSGDKIILYLGRICEDKGFFDFLEVSKKLISEIKNLNILIVGRNELPESVQNFIPKTLLSHVKIVNWTLEPEKYLIVSDILLLPSKREGFGNVFLEASAASCIPVGYNILGVNSAVINNHTGILVPLNKTVKLYEACIRLFRDSNFKDELTINGLSYVKEFDRRIFHDKLLKFYESELLEVHN